MKKKEIRKIIEDLKIKIEEKKKVLIRECRWCGLSQQVQDVEKLQTELCVWEQCLGEEKD